MILFKLKSSKTKLKENELGVEEDPDLEDGEISGSDNEGKPNVDDDKRGTSNQCDDKIVRNKSCKTASHERNSLDKISERCETRNIGNKSDNEVTREKPHSNRNYRKKTSDDSEIKPSNSDCENHEKLLSREKISKDPEMNSRKKEKHEKMPPEEFSRDRNAHGNHEKNSHKEFSHEKNAHENVKFEKTPHNGSRGKNSRDDTTKLDLTKKNLVDRCDEPRERVKSPPRRSSCSKSKSEGSVKSDHAADISHRRKSRGSMPRSRSRSPRVSESATKYSDKKRDYKQKYDRQQASKNFKKR